MPPPCTKIAKVGVALALICRGHTAGPMAEMHCAGSRVGLTRKRCSQAKTALPVSADAVMLPLAPTFTVATAKAPVPVAPGIFTMPSLVSVAAKATMSGTGVAGGGKQAVCSGQ